MVAPFTSATVSATIGLPLISPLKSLLNLMITTIRICGKTSDLCHTALQDDKGKVVIEKEGYAPSFMPGGDGDYIDLVIDVATGQIKNWKVPSQKKLLADMA